MLRVMRSAFSRLDEKEEGRILQPHRQSRADAQVRAKFYGGRSIFRARTDAHGARDRRGLHERYSARVSSPRRSTHLALPGRFTALHPNAIARLRQANRSAHNEGPVARFDSPGRPRLAFDQDRVRQGRLHFESARDRTSDDEESGEGRVKVDVGRYSVEALKRYIVCG